jgi:hypothetical protein
VKERKGLEGKRKAGAQACSADILDALKKREKERERKHRKDRKKVKESCFLTRKYGSEKDCNEGGVIISTALGLRVRVSHITGNTRSTAQHNKAHNIVHTTHGAQATQHSINSKHSTAQHT